MRAKNPAQQLLNEKKVPVHGFFRYMLESFVDHAAHNPLSSLTAFF